MLVITGMVVDENSWMIGLNDVKSYNTIKYNAYYRKKPYIHYIDVKIMNNVSRVATGLTSL